MYNQEILFSIQFYYYTKFSVLGYEKESHTTTVSYDENIVHPNEVATMNYHSTIYNSKNCVLTFNYHNNRNNRLTISLDRFFVIVPKE